MADIHDMSTAEGDADAAMRALQSYMGQVEDAEREADPAFVAGLAATALVFELRALAMRLDYVARDLVKRSGRA